MIPNGRQFREGRQLLKLQAWEIAKAVGLSTAMVFLAECDDTGCAIEPAPAHALRKALEAAGVEFFTGDHGTPSVRLREDIPR